MSDDGRIAEVLQLIDSYLREGTEIEIDGMGRFELTDDHVVFQPNGRPRVFLSHAKEDRAEVRKLYEALQEAGFEPWMDDEKLLPGQNWPRAIQRAIELSDFFLICFSRHSVMKRGFFQAELRYALDVAACVPLEEIFIVPTQVDRLRSAASNRHANAVYRSVSKLGKGREGVDSDDEGANNGAGEEKRKTS